MYNPNFHLYECQYISLQIGYGSPKDYTFTTGCVDINAAEQLLGEEYTELESSGLTSFFYNGEVSWMFTVENTRDAYKCMQNYIIKHVTELKLKHEAELDAFRAFWRICDNKLTN